MTSGPGDSLEVAAPGYAARCGLPLGAVVDTLLPGAAAAALRHLVARQAALAGKARLTAAERLDADRLDTALGLLLGAGGLLEQVGVRLRLAAGAARVAAVARGAPAHPAALAAAAGEARRLEALARARLAHGSPAPDDDARAVAALARLAALASAHADAAAALARHAAGPLGRLRLAGPLGHGVEDVLHGHRAGLRLHLAAALHRGQADAAPAAAGIHDAHRALDAVLAALGPEGGHPRPARAAGLLELYAVAVQAAAGEAGTHLAPGLAALSAAVAEAVLAEDTP